MVGRRQPEPPTPDLTITIKGNDRRLGADALIEACRDYEIKGAALVSGRRRLPAGGRYSLACADRLRAIYDQVIP